LPFGVEHIPKIRHDALIFAKKRHPGFVLTIIPERENAGLSLICNPSKGEKRVVNHSKLNAWELRYELLLVSEKGISKFVIAIGNRRGLVPNAKVVSAEN